MSKLKTIFKKFQNKLLLSFILIPGIAYNSICYALQGNYNIDAYGGSETILRKMRFKKNFGSKVFQDPIYTEFNFFIGCKLNQYFGIEAGYELSDTKIHSKRAQNGSLLFGSRLVDSHAGFDSITNFVHSRSEIQGINLNLMTFLPIVSGKNLNLIGSVGLGYLKSNTKCNLAEIGESNINLDDGLNIPVQKFVLTESIYKNRVITIRASTGIQYLARRDFGIRCLVGWENTHKIKIRGVDGFTGKKINEHAKFKDSITYRIGFFIPF
jgi:hypothetical protein